MRNCLAVSMFHMLCYYNHHELKLWIISIWSRFTAIAATTEPVTIIGIWNYHELHHSTPPESITTACNLQLHESTTPILPISLTQS